VSRVIHDLSCGTDLDNPAHINDRDPIAEQRGKFNIMRNE
jgi:hypothetical protein